MGKKKVASSGIATKRVRDLLDYHIDMLTKPNRKFYMLRDEGYYLESDINPKNSDDYVKIGYSLSKKFLTRTYNFEIKTVFLGVDFRDSFDLKLKFSGFPKIEVVYFGSKKKNEEYVRLYNDSGLIEKLKNIARKVDIGYITISFNKHAQRLDITVSPIAGAFLWVVFPPIFQKIALKQEEIDALWEAMIAIRKHTEKLLK